MNTVYIYNAQSMSYVRHSKDLRCLMDNHRVRHCYIKAIGIYCFDNGKGQIMVYWSNCDHCYAFFESYTVMIDWLNTHHRIFDPSLVHHMKDSYYHTVDEILAA